MASSKDKEKQEGGEEKMSEPTLEERLGGLNLQGEEDLDFFGEYEELVRTCICWPCLGFIRRSRSAMRPCSVR